MGTKTRQFDRSLFQVLKEGFWALLTPVIIMGGIYSGVFSATESAAIACGYAFIVGKFIYKELNIKALYRAMYNSMLGAVSIMFLIMAASFFGWVMTMQGLPQAVSRGLLSIVSDKVTFLLLVNVLFLIAGMFMDIGSILLLVIPLLYGVASALGVDLLHFGVIACINLSLGQATPPFGACLFVANGIDKSVKMEQIYREVIPFCLTGIVGILIVTFVPALSMWVK
jgi:C4-dicarboxylate transporter DctM subunit